MGLLVLVPYPCSAQGVAPKLPVPEEAAANASLSIVREIYEAAYQRATSIDQIRDLVRELLQTATKSDPAGQYALLRVAKDIAGKEADLPLAFEAIEQLALRFEVDALSLRKDAIKAAAKSSRNPPDVEAFVRLIVLVIEDSVQADRYDFARDLGKIAVDSAGKARNGQLKEQVERRNEQIGQIEKEFDSIKEFFDVLKDEPQHAEANAKVGAFRCFLKGDWTKGLPCLALGDDEVFQSLAEAEMAEQPNAAALGDDWWDLSEAAEGIAKRQLMLHAADWYRKGLAEMDGLSKVKAESRILVSSSRPPDEAGARLKAKAPNIIDPSRVNLNGTWKSIATGNYFLIRDNGTGITVALQSGKNLESFNGTLAREGSALTSTHWECIFKSDASKQPRQASFKGQITGPNRIVAKITKFDFDRDGNITKRSEGRAVWIKQAD